MEMIIVLYFSQAHGLVAHKLLFSDLVKKLAFHHCEGVIPDHTSSHHDDVELVCYNWLMLLFHITLLLDKF